MTSFEPTPRWRSRPHVRHDAGAGLAAATDSRAGRREWIRRRDLGEAQTHAGGTHYASCLLDRYGRSPASFFSSSPQLGPPLSRHLYGLLPAAVRHAAMILGSFSDSRATTSAKGIGRAK
jgi:hypothetical protein